jgi:predicted small lipoprotein YifL
MKKPTSTLILVCAAATAATLSACGPKGPVTIPVLDVTKTYPAKTLTLQDIATVEYIPLETREGFLIDQTNVKYMDDEIIVTANNAADIMTFDRRTGKGLTSFNRVGRGPGEFSYAFIHSLAVDGDRNEIYVSNGVNFAGEGYPIYIYDLEGKHLRTLHYQDLNTPEFLHNYDDEHLFFYNEDIEIAEPYGLISKTDTLVTSLPVKFNERNTMAVVREIEGRVVGRNRSYNSAIISKTREGYMLSEPGVDTIFHWNKDSGKLTPVVTRTPAFNSMEYPIGLFYMGESRDYIFLQTVERKLDFDNPPYEGFNTVQLIYDKRDGGFFEGTIVNGDFHNRSIRWQIMSGVPAGQYVIGLQPYDIIASHEEGFLQGRLAEIAPTLKEDDNPVMMIVTFK